MTEPPAPDQPGVPPTAGYPAAGSAQPYATPGGYPQPVGGQPYAGYPVQPGAPVPPPTTPLQPGHYPYPTTAAYPTAQPGYPVQPGYPGYPVGGYPVAPASPPAPGVVKSAAVLAFVQGGLIVVAGVTGLSGTSSFRDLGLEGVNSRFTMVMIMSILAVIAGGLLIAGGVQAYNRKSVLLITGAAISLALSLSWVILSQSGRSWDVGARTAILVWSLLLAVLPILCIALMTGAAGRAWTAKSR